MARRKKTAAQLQAELDEANDYIEELEGKIDDISGIVSGDDQDDEDDSDDDDLEDDDLDDDDTGDEDRGNG